ncbi:MAG TPA: 4Fe-4S double cluster binding domain-containing protein [Spirochaetota bacterium]|nr:4Fe-4S double cluster binding domain-containing protein [Spirochaetota bacterium]
MAGLRRINNGGNMITREDVIDKAAELGFVDVGFTTAEPFADHRAILEKRMDDYGWAEDAGLALLSGTDPASILDGAKTVIVLLEGYFQKAFPASMEQNFGRCYIDDDRVTKDGLAKRIKAFRGFLRDNGIDSRVPFNLPHRVAAARAGLGTFGKNCLFYAGRAVRGSSWVLPVAVVINHEFAPDTPTVELGCPDWCRNACIAACPTKALQGNCKIDPRKCISYLTYYGEGLTPRELREPMGMYVYGCDRCQNVCPRNAPWSGQALPVNEKAAMKAEDFDLPKLLHMDKEYFESRIWPHMFYMSYNDIWRWKMNVARVMGNSLDRRYVQDLIRAFDKNVDDRVRAMAAWALGKIGGHEAVVALQKFKEHAAGMVREEIDAALEMAERSSVQRVLA